MTEKFDVNVLAQKLADALLTPDNANEILLQLRDEVSYAAAAYASRDRGIRFTPSMISAREDVDDSDPVVQLYWSTTSMMYMQILTCAASKMVTWN